MGEYGGEAVPAEVPEVRGVRRRVEVVVVRLVLLRLLVPERAFGEGKTLRERGEGETLRARVVRKRTCEGVW